MLHVNHLWEFNGIITALYLLEEELSKKKKHKWKVKNQIFQDSVNKEKLPKK